MTSIHVNLGWLGFGEFTNVEKLVKTARQNLPRFLVEDDAATFTGTKCGGLMGVEGQ